MNLESITTNEENRIPGMDLINMIGNSVHSLKIYNKYHKDVPYSGAQSTDINKDALTFMGYPFTGIIPEFINKLLTEIEKNKDNIDWGFNQTNLKNLFHFNSPQSVNLFNKGTSNSSFITT